jgi:hypothetical protein
MEILKMMIERVRRALRIARIVDEIRTSAKNREAERLKRAGARAAGAARAHEELDGGAK